MKKSYLPILQSTKRFDGVHYLDIVVETPETEDLFKPENLQRIEKLQDYVITLPHVNGSTSIVDYLKADEPCIKRRRKICLPATQ